MNWYVSALKNYATFSGRARRTEYWMFALFNFLIAVILLILARITDSSIVTIIYVVYLLAIQVPSIAVLVRRLHDIGKSGAWFWIGLIPIIGGIWLLVLTVTPGNTGENAYGPDPKA